jgi:[acyl-carrier-protein] S-malonyltransferase
MNYALLFSGQGTQHAGMLPWLESEPASKSALQALQLAVGSDWRSTLANKDLRSSNAFAQPLIVATSLAASAALAVHMSGRPAVVAGYSVGELSAFACAGVFAPSIAIDLASKRAACMDAAAQEIEGGLISISGMPIQAVLQWFPGLECAIHITADHGIYAGPSTSLVECSLALSEQNALCKRLEIRVASHSHWMDQATVQFSAHLQSIPFARPVSALALNSTGGLSRQADTLRAALAQQINSTVQWAVCMETISELGVACVLEVGAGSTLSKMWNQQHPDIPARSIEEFRDLEGAARWIERIVI